MNDSLATRISASLRDVPDFPKAGILFRDITPLLANPALLAEAIARMAEPFRNAGITHVVGIESRGFLFGVPIALELSAAFVPARKPGKLPYLAARQQFALEYGIDAIEMHTDAFPSGSRVLVVDDILATGGTVQAACLLTERLSGEVCGVSVLAEIGGLRNNEMLRGRQIHSLLVV